MNLHDVEQLVQKLSELKFLVVVTNQSGVARGYFELSDVEVLHGHMKKQFLDYGVILSGIYVCPHHPEGAIKTFSYECECRKGRPGMLLKAAAELKIDLACSFMVGDKFSDLDAGYRAGCRSFLISSAPGKRNSFNLPEYCESVFDNLEEFAEYILHANTT